MHNRSPASSSPPTASRSVAGGLGRNWSLFILAAALIVQGVFVVWTSASPKNHASWERVISTPIWPAYADLRVMTNGWDEVAAGFDPLRMDADAPLYNYPRLWLAGGKLGGRSSDAPWLGAGLAGLFLAMTFFVMKTAPGWTRLLALGIMVSPPIWLGLERGNIDLLMFALVTPALLASPVPGWRSGWPPFAVLLAALLKLYPAVCLAGCLHRASRMRALLVTLVALAFGTYLAVTRADVRAMLVKTEHGVQESYGANLAADKLQTAWSAQPSYRALAPAWLAVESSRHQALRLVLGSLLATAVLCAWWTPLRSALLGRQALPATAARLFLAGAAVYLATFLLGANWAYRLLFLLWTLPLLGHALAHGDRRLRFWAGLTLGLIGFICWQLARQSDLAVLLAHLACIALTFPLALLGGALLLPESRDCSRTTVAIAACSVLLVGVGVLIANGRADSPGRPAFWSNPFSQPGDEAWALVLRGKAQASDGQLAEARASYEEALRLRPDYADAHNQLGTVLWAEGWTHEAVARFERAIELQPRSVGARNNLGDALRHQQRWEQAIAAYQAALVIRPDDATTHDNLGSAYMMAGRPAEAVAQFEAVLRTRPDDAAAERNLGVALAGAGRTAEAVPHFERALRLLPDYADVELQWGLVLAGENRLAGALVHFEKAVALDPGYGRAHYVLALALRRLGRPAEAAAHHREAVRLDPSLDGR